MYIFIIVTILQRGAVLLHNKEVFFVQGSFFNFIGKEISRVIDWLREMKNAHQWDLEENSWRWNYMYRVRDSGAT